MRFQALYFVPSRLWCILRFQGQFSSRRYRGALLRYLTIVSPPIRTVETMEMLYSQSITYGRG